MAFQTTLSSKLLKTGCLPVILYHQRPSPVPEKMWSLEAGGLWSQVHLWLKIKEKGMENVVLGGRWSLVGEVLLYVGTHRCGGQLKLSLDSKIALFWSLEHLLMFRAQNPPRNLFPCPYVLSDWSLKNFLRLQLSICIWFCTKECLIDTFVANDII